MQRWKSPNSASSRLLMIFALALDFSLFGKTAFQKSRTLRYITSCQVPDSMVASVSAARPPAGMAIARTHATCYDVLPCRLFFPVLVRHVFCSAPGLHGPRQDAHKTLGTKP